MVMDSNQIFSREFLEIRAKILEIAASLDRLERAEGCCDDPRLQLIQDGLGILNGEQTDKAVAVQLLFSREYEDGWKQEFGI